MDNDCNKYSTTFIEALEKLDKHRKAPDLVKRIVSSVPFQDLHTELDLIEEEQQKQRSLKVVH